MKIVVTGTRGIPEIQGGVETHCQELYPRMAARGHDVTVICRTSYVTDPNLTEYKGVKLLNIATPRRKSLEAIVHTFRAVMAARRLKPDVVHIHAIGPQLMVPVARLMGLKVVSTNHGPDYNRKKWGRLARTALKLGERMAAKFSNAVISISEDIRKSLHDKYGCSSFLIFNGVNKPAKSKSSDYIESLGLAPHKYVLALGRFVKEKGFDDLIHAFAKAELAQQGWKLAIAGDADHEDAFSLELKQLAKDTEGVVLTGFIRGERLNQVLTNAGLFVLPSYHEGLPIALLEALSYDLDVLVSDIPANTLSCLEPTDFFRVGNVDELSRALQRKTASAAPRTYDLRPYDWDEICTQTLDVYSQILRKS